jgi:putative transposase
MPALTARDKAWGADRKGAADSPQLTFAARKTWGGPRKGAGRKPAARRNVPHAIRTKHWRSSPVHVTLRRAKGLPSLRSGPVHHELREAVRATRREGFRITHYTVQHDHVHMIVEADDGVTLAAGLKSFAVRAARRVNTRVLRRRGSLWGDRHHRRELRSPRSVRNALVYVMSNHLKHQEWDAGLVDPCSSGPWFEGWMQNVERPPHPPPVERAQTWLLRRGWHGDIDFIWLGELPRALRDKMPAR